MYLTPNIGHFASTPIGVMRVGSTEPPGNYRHLSGGDLSASVCEAEARGLAWHGIQIATSLAAVIRDAQWNVMPLEIVRQRSDHDADGFSHCSVFRLSGDGAEGVLNLTASDARFIARLKLTAFEPLTVNRAGLVLLTAPFAGHDVPVEVLKASGASETGMFPVRIAAERLFTDVAGLEYKQDAIRVRIRFEGDVFETEDQRNWTDFSFKTYSRPLSLPFPFTIEAGGEINQQIVISLEQKRTQRPSPSSARASSLRFHATKEKLPEPALVVDSMSVPIRPQLDLLRGVGFRAVQVRLRVDEADEMLPVAARIVEEIGAETEFEIVIPAGIEPHAGLSRVGERAARLDMRPRLVAAAPEAYLRRLRPGVARPRPDLNDAAMAARRAFPGAAIAWGILTNFTELNRAPPCDAKVDAVTHGTCAIQHDAGDQAVADTIGGLRHAFASTRRLAGRRRYRLGLVSIGLRSNPHAGGCAPNPAQIRMPAAQADPRQRGLFGAAFAVAAVAATESFDVDGMGLGAAHGPFGILSAQEAWVRPGYDDDTSALVYPIFHAIRAIAAMGGKPRLSVSGLPEGMHCVAVQRTGGVMAVFANMRDSTVTADFGKPAAVTVLDTSTMPSAVADPAWLDRPRADMTHVELPPYALAFVSLEGTLP